MEWGGPWGPNPWGLSPRIRFRGADPEVQPTQPLPSPTDPGMTMPVTYYWISILDGNRGTPLGRTQDEPLEEQLLDWVVLPYMLSASPL